jgi:small-conductance mechanosensitive channel
MIRKLFVLVVFSILSFSSYLFYLWLPETVTQNIFHSLVVFTISYALFSVGLEEVMARRISDTKTRYSIRKTISLFLILIVAILWLRIWVPNPQALLVAYGVIAAGLAVALQDLVKNLAGSITVFLTGIYRVGNRIEINGTYGDVIDIGLFNTTLMEIREWLDADQPTGRITTVPNGAVLNKPVKNFTKLHKYLWDELSFVVTSESNWEEAMRLVGEIGEEHTNQYIEGAEKSLSRLERYYYVEGHVLKPNVYIKPATDGYQITLRYVVDAWKRRSTNSNIWGHIIRVCNDSSDIIIAPRTLASMEYPLPK